jgi:hypothetical protein
VIDRSENYTLAELRTKFSGSTPTLLMFEMIFAATHETRLRIVEAAIDYIVQEMVKSRQAHQDKSEDELTISIVGNLKSMGFRATHDTQYGGHCDIVLEARDEFLWMAEAKKHSSYGWLLEGMKQLTTRYLTGLPGQDAGDLLIYLYQPRSDIVMGEWEIRLQKEYPADQIHRCERNYQDIRSIHVNKATGNLLRVRHKAIPLYFEPEK